MPHQTAANEPGAMAHKAAAAELSSAEVNLEALMNQGQLPLESSAAAALCAIAPGSLAAVWWGICLLSLAAVAVLAQAALGPAQGRR